MKIHNSKFYIAEGKSKKASLPGFKVSDGMAGKSESGKDSVGKKEQYVYEDIYVIENGSLTEEGNHEQLRNGSGLYSQLCVKQSLG